jgi:hypothetical protein
MNFNRTLDNWGLKLLKLLERIVPAGSDLDTLFNSYDDWRQMRYRIQQIKYRKLSRLARRKIRSSLGPGFEEPFEVAKGTDVGSPKIVSTGGGN